MTPEEFEEFCKQVFLEEMYEEAYREDARKADCERIEREAIAWKKKKIREMGGYDE